MGMIIFYVFYVALLLLLVILTISNIRNKFYFLLPLNIGAMILFTIKLLSAH